MTKHNSSFKRVHYVKVRIVFDKPIRVADAVAEFDNCVWGTHRINVLEPGDPSKFEIKGVARAKGNG